MPLLFLRDRRLYTDYAHWRQSFFWNARAAGRLLLYHCYWNGVLSYLHELSLKSLMLTQSPPYEVWVWMPPKDVGRNRHFIAEFATTSYIRFKEYIPEHEARDTVFSVHTALLSDEAPRAVRGRAAVPRKPTAVSDGLRLLALARYGGVYFDFDTLFLKDLRPLAEVSFIYQWSNQPFGTNAISHFPQDAPGLWALAERSIKLGSCFPPGLLRFAELVGLPGDVHVFPSFLFDPAWIAHDTHTPINDYCNNLNDFFDSNHEIALDQFFPESYAYDWHNRWERTFDPRAMAGQLYNQVTAAWHAHFRS